MEVVAKFLVLDAGTCTRLKQAATLAGYRISPGESSRLDDTYFDTATRAILTADYTFRRRVRGEGQTVLITLKSLGTSRGAIDRRDELAESTSPSAVPNLLPEGPVRDRVLALAGAQTLEPIVRVRQIRATRLVCQGSRQVAELSLDRVRFINAGPAHAQLIVEVELLPGGVEEDLTALAACLRDEWNLTPQRVSKFEQALTYLAQERHPAQLLSIEECTTFRAVSERDDLHCRRARSLLAVDERLTQAQAGTQAGMSARRVRHWVAAFRKQRLGIFPDRVLSPVTSEQSLGDSAPHIRPDEPRRIASAPEVPVSEAASGRGMTSGVRPDPSRSRGIELDNTMSEAARKTLLLHLGRMPAHEPGTRAGDDSEELHDMRVATRRMRAACDVYRDYVDWARMAPFAEGLRGAGRALGRVRDLDVFWQKTQRYLDRLPAHLQPDLGPLRVVWEAERLVARTWMIAYLDSPRYARFTQRFGDFLQSSGAGELSPLLEDGEPRPRRVRHLAPVVVYRRVAAKALRYAVEFFREVLAPEAQELIDRVKGLQDHLGDLNDALVASRLLRDFMVWGTW